jgi:hypothetical protein
MKNNKINLLILVLIVTGIGLFFIIKNPNLTGFAIKENGEQYSVDLNKSFSRDSIFTFTPLKEGKLMSISISGYTTGKAQIYLDDLLIYDSSGKGSLITGMVVDENIDNSSIEPVVENLKEDQIIEVNDRVFDNNTEDANLNIDETINHINETIKESNESITQDLNDTLIEKEDVQNTSINENIQITFNDECLQTCNIRLNEKNYTITVKVKEGKLFISNITYTVKPEQINISMTEPIPDIFIESGSNYSINLLQYFKGENLTFSTLYIPNIAILIEGDAAILIPEQGFLGETRTVFFAKDLQGNTMDSNIVHIT